MAGVINANITGVLSPYAAREKGDIQNRVNCSGAHLANNANALAKDVVIIGGAAAATAAAVKYPQVGNKVQKGLSKAVNWVKLKLSKAFNKLGKTRMARKLNVAAYKFKKLPLNTKGTIGVIAGLATLALGATHLNKVYKAGQIDQKYTDRAAIREHMEYNVI